MSTCHLGRKSCLHAIGLYSQVLPGVFMCVRFMCFFYNLPYFNQLHAHTQKASAHLHEELRSFNRGELALI